MVPWISTVGAGNSQARELELANAILAVVDQAEAFERSSLAVTA